MAEPASLLLFGAVVVGVVLAVAAGLAPRPSTRVVRYMFLADASMVAWTTAYFIQLSWGHYPDPALAPFGSAENLLLVVLILGLSLSPTYWFLFTAALNPRAGFFLHGPGLLLAYVPAAYTFAVAVTNPLHHLFIRLDAAGHAAGGPLAVPHYVLTLGLVVTGTVLMVWPPAPFATATERRQRIYIATAALLPLAGSLAWVGARVARWPIPFNPTPALFTVVGCVLAYQVLYRGFGDVIPLARLSTIVENADALLAYLAPDLTFVSVNEAFKRRSRRLEPELLGRGYFDVMPDEGRRQLFERARVTGTTIERTNDPDVFVRASGGPPSYWNWTLAPVSEGTGLRGFVLSLTDVTDAVRERDLARTAAELEVRLQRGFARKNALREVVLEAGLALGCDTILVTHDRERGWRLRHTRSAATEPFQRQAYPHIAQAIDSGGTIVVADARIDERFDSATLAAHEIRSALVVPLVADDETIGALCFQCPDMSRTFTSMQVEFAERFAASVAFSIENTRRYRDEKHIAQTLQESMLRISFEHPALDFSHVYRSATEAARVGGDFYDLFGTDDGRIGLLIGDVAGHGIEAAVLTSLIKHAVRSAAIEHDSPARVMARASEVLRRESEPEVFASAFYGVLDPRDGSLRYCSAGHPPAVIVDEQGWVSELTQHSFVLGLPTESWFDEARARIEPGQLLLAYTDGLTEARRGPDFYGFPRLRDVLQRTTGRSAEEIVSELFADVRSFSGDVFADDVAVVALRLLPPAAAKANAGASPA